MLQTATAQRAHVGLECSGFFGRRCTVATAQQPVKLVLFKRLDKPAERKQGGTRQADPGERDSEREFEYRRVCAGCVLQESAFNFAARLVRVLDDDEKTRVGISVKLLTAPAGAGRELQLLVRRAIGEYLCGRHARLDRMPFAPRFKDPLLDGKEAIEPCEHQGSARCAIFFEKVQKRQGHTACA